jgi:hypothetical protein
MGAGRRDTLKYLIEQMVQIGKMGIYPLGAFMVTVELLEEMAQQMSVEVGLGADMIVDALIE